MFTINNNNINNYLGRKPESNLQLIKMADSVHRVVGCSSDKFITSRLIEIFVKIIMVTFSCVVKHLNKIL